MIEDEATKRELSDIVIVGGTREAMQDVSTSDFKKRSNELVEKAKTVTAEITASSILPCNRSDMQHVAALNTGLRAACSEIRGQRQ